MARKKTPPAPRSDWARCWKRAATKHRRASTVLALENQRLRSELHRPQVVIPHGPRLVVDLGSARELALDMLGMRVLGAQIVERTPHWLAEIVLGLCEEVEALREGEDDKTPGAAMETTAAPGEQPHIPSQ